MSSKKKILVFDDETTARRRYQKTLQAVPGLNRTFDVSVLDNPTFENELNVLKERRNRFRDGDSPAQPQCQFDDVSILVIDWELLQSSVFIDGESVAYLVRCFSTCRAIILLNKFGHNNFDLTLKGHPESFADLNIGSQQLDSLGLWGQPQEGFHPWYWPSLLTHLKHFEKQCTEIRQHLDSPIFEVLGLPLQIAKYLPKSIAEFLGGEPTEVTFRQVVSSSPFALQPRDAKKGAQTRTVPPEMIARIASARISKWLERLVLTGQDILVDAQHLVSRFPSVLRRGINNMDYWQRTARLAPKERLNIDWEKIESFRFKKDHWLSRPAWFWPAISQFDDIPEVKTPWKTSLPDWVFCEDISRFVNSEAEPAPREFTADTESPFARRYVTKVPRVSYEPVVRFY